MAAAASPFTVLSRSVLTGALLAMLWGAGGIAHARDTAMFDAPQAAEGARVVDVDTLPPQGQRIYQAIFRGGPFRHEKDGTVFGNRERLLPRERRGHYREYTVDTPGVRHRGARRIVCGGPARQPHACWYTADHYASFRRIVP